MSDINKWIGNGRLTRDGELSYVGETPLLKFSIASNRYAGRDKEEKTYYFDCEYWGAGAKAIAQYMTKGKAVLLEAILVQDRWEKDGSKRSKLKLEVKQCKLIGGNGNAAPKPANKTSAYDDFEDDVPF